MQEKIQVKRALYLLLTLSGLRLMAQDYYPLGVGNVWYLSSVPTVIIDRTVLDDTEYYLTLDSTYQRIDENGNVFVRGESTSEYVWLKLKAGMNESWEILYHAPPHAPIRLFGTLVSKNAIVQTADTTFYDCFQYAFRYVNIIDADYDVYLAPNVGIVKRYSVDWGLGTSLQKALVSGKRIPSKIVPPDIVETNPQNDRHNIPVDAQITVLFKFRIKPEFINDENIKVISKKQGMVPYHLRIRSDIDAWLVPDDPFMHDDTVTVFVSDRIEDYMGDNLPADYYFTFFTEPLYLDPGIFIQDDISEIANLSRGDFDMADYDNDGDIDLILAGVEDIVDVGVFPYLYIYNNNSGVFRKADYSFNATRADGSAGCVKFVDFNNDGWMDVVFTGEDVDHALLTQFYENDNLTLTLQPNMTLNYGRACMDWCDFDKDGFPDLAISGNTWPKSQDVVIYRNENGRLTKHQSLDLGGYHPGIHQWIDFNSDGWMDIIKTGYQLKDTKLFQNEDGNFVSVPLSITSERWLPYNYNIEHSDFDRDGDIDLLISPFLLKRDGDLFALDETQLEDYTDAFAKFSDYNKDGCDDLFVFGNKYDKVGRERTYIHLYQNDGERLSLLKEMRFSKELYLFSARWFDLNNDDKIDLAAMTDDGFMIYYNSMETTGVTSNPLHPSTIIYQNYPNPFNSRTIIRYNLSAELAVRLEIFDIQGRKVATLIDQHQEKGEHKVDWKADGLAAGVYFYKIQAGEYRDVRKLLLVK